MNLLKEKARASAEARAVAWALWRRGTQNIAAGCGRCRIMVKIGLTIV
jgi:hypothetical protein